jgi:hypothetical protein
MSYNGYFFFCVSCSPSLLRSFAQLTHIHKPSHGPDTCEMLHNTRKATLNRIGTQRKKRGYKGGASYTYAKVRRCQNTWLAVMSMKVEWKTSRSSGVPMPSSRCWCRRGIIWHEQGTQKSKSEHTSMPKNLGQKGLTKVVKIYVKITLNFVSKGV